MHLFGGTTVHRMHDRCYKLDNKHGMTTNKPAIAASREDITDALEKFAMTLIGCVALLLNASAA